MPSSEQPVFPTPRMLRAFLRGNPLRGVPVSVFNSPIMSGIRQGTIKIRSWADLVPLFASAAVVGADVWPWLMAHAATRATKAPRAAQDWRSLAHQMIPKSSTEDTALSARSAAHAHMLAAAAVEFRQPILTDWTEQPVLEAGHLLALCLLPDRAAFLPLAKISAVREAILDSLVSSRRPYGMHHAGVPTPSCPRKQLARSLDGTTAYWLKIGAGRGPGLLSSIDQVREFLDRLDSWPQAEQALARTASANHSPYTPATEPRTVSELVLASSSISLLAELGRPGTHVRPADWGAWFRRPADPPQNAIGPLQSVVATSSVTPAHAVLFDRLARELTLEPLAGGAGKTFAHLLLARCPTKGALQIILDALGPDAMAVQDDAGTTPLGAAAARLSLRFPADTVRTTMADLEKMVLQAAQAEMPASDATLQRSRRL